MQWRPRILGVARVAIAAVLTSPLAAHADWVLWPSPFEGHEAIDQQQTRHDGSLRVPGLGRGAIGQTFVPKAVRLRRIDVQVMNRFDSRPGRFRLWRWRGSRARTVSAPPLFQDTLVLAGRGAWQTRSFFPAKDVVPGEAYYLELSAPGRDAFLVRGQSAEAYPPGAAFQVRGERGSPLTGDIWFRTWAATSEPPAEQPPIRWSRQEPWHAPPPPRPVSRDDYRARVTAMADYLRSRLGRSCGQRPEHAIYDAFLYRTSCAKGACNDSYARSVRDLLLRAHARRFCLPGLPASCDAKEACEARPRIRFHWLERPALAYLWTRDSRVYAAEDHAAVQALLVDSADRFWPEREGGSFNRSLGAAAGYQLMAKLFPGHARTAAWQSYADDVWAALAETFDTEEDSSSYTTGVFAPSVLLLAKLSGREQELWRAPGFRGLVERLAAQVLPAGVVPPYGDGSGWTTGQGGLIWLLESAAVRLGEPRYRRIARQAFQFKRSRARDHPPASDAFSSQLPYLAMAYLDARDAPPAGPPGASDAASLVTQRPEVQALPLSQAGPLHRLARFGPRLVPGKLVLRSGADPDDLAILVNFLSGYAHGRPSSGAVEGLLDGGSIVLSQTGFQKGAYAFRPEDESTALVRRYTGGRYQVPGGSAELSAFADLNHVSVAQLDWLDADGWAVEQRRRFLFVKNRLLWVRDRFRFPAEMRVAVGPVWHAGDVSSQHGSHWFDVSYREPMGATFRFLNPERYATLFFVPRRDAIVEALRVAAYDPPPGCDAHSDAGKVSARCASSPPFVLSQRWSGAAHPGQTRWLDSIIVPHGPELGPAEAADRIQVLADDGEAVALRVELAEEQWILIDNPAQRLVEVPGVATDASFAALRLEPTEHRYELVVDGTTLRTAHGERSWATRTTHEEGDTAPLRLPR